MSHRLIRTRNKLESEAKAPNLSNTTNEEERQALLKASENAKLLLEDDDGLYQSLVPEFEFVERPVRTLDCHLCEFPAFLFETCPPVATPGRLAYAYDRSMAYKMFDHVMCSGVEGLEMVWNGGRENKERFVNRRYSMMPLECGGINAIRPARGFSNIVIPGKL